MQLHLIDNRRRSLRIGLASASVCCALALPWALTARAQPTAQLATTAQSERAPHALAPADAPLFEILRHGGKPVRWHPDRAGRDIKLTYAIVREQWHSPGAINCSGLQDPAGLLAHAKISAEAFRMAVRRGFDFWQGPELPTFTETLDQHDADILIGAQTEPRGLAFTSLSFTPDTSASATAIAASRICLNPQAAWKIGFDGDRSRVDIAFTIAHEVGHALGLDHPSARGTLMSFRYLEDHTTLSAGDRAGLNFLYGARAQRAPLESAHLDRTHLDSNAGAPKPSVDGPLPR